MIQGLFSGKISDIQNVVALLGSETALHKKVWDHRVGIFGIKSKMRLFNKLNTVWYRQWGL